MLISSEKLGWSIWWLSLILWSIGLLRPEPIQLQHHLISENWGWLIAKGLHFTVYFYLAFSAFMLPSHRSYLILCITFLIFHSGATEFLQQWVKDRTGSLTDIAIDLSGIMIGVTLYFLLKKFGRLNLTTKKV